VAALALIDAMTEKAALLDPRHDDRSAAEHAFHNNSLPFTPPSHFPRQSRPHRRIDASA